MILILSNYFDCFLSNRKVNYDQKMITKAVKLKHTNF